MFCDSCDVRKYHDTDEHLLIDYNRLERELYIVNNF